MAVAAAAFSVKGSCGDLISAASFVSAAECPFVDVGRSTGVEAPVWGKLTPLSDPLFASRGTVSLRFGTECLFDISKLSWRGDTTIPSTNRGFLFGRSVDSLLEGPASLHITHHIIS